MVNDVDYVDIKVSKKDYSRVEKENNVCVNVFCYENDLVYPANVSRKKIWKMYGFIVDNRLK